MPPARSSFGIHALVTSHYFEGGAYPVGGASRIAASLLPTIERAGGVVVVDAEVTKVLLDGDRAIGVRMVDGRELPAARVISDVGARATLDHLVPQDAPGAVRSVASRLSTIPASMAHLCLYVGLDATRLSKPLHASNLWVHPGLDFDRNLSRFEADPDAPFPFLFISFPSAKDSSFAGRYPGHGTIEVVTLAPHTHFAQWAGTAWRHRTDDYEVMKRRLEHRMVAELYRHVPAVEGAVTRWELSTPLSTQHFAGAAHGEMYGLAHTPERFLSRDLRPRTPIRNLFLTGQDVGTCGVMALCPARSPPRRPSSDATFSERLQRIGRSKCIRLLFLG